jgi:hypothetical protein
MKFKLKILGPLVVLVLTSGCVYENARATATRWWNIGFTEPAYMKVWVEEASEEDVNGKFIPHIGEGSASGGQMGLDKEYARGWLGEGFTKYPAVGAGLPRRIFVRWQSIAEPQTYRAWVDIPEEAREILKRASTELCPEQPTNHDPQGGHLTLGLAPGGIVQIWVLDECARPVKVARGVAEVEPLGPDQGKSNGEYAYKVSEEAQQYIQRYGIPYGSW